MCALGWIPWLDTGVCRCFREFHIEAANLTAAEDIGYKGQDDLLYGFRMVLLTVCHFFSALKTSSGNGLPFASLVGGCWEMLGKILEGMTEIYPTALMVLTVEF